jgi:SAM-dependent methyltransferase
MPTVALYDEPALYDLVVTPGPCEAFYRELARRTDGPVLELACGTGRLTVPLARDGQEVVGLDASPAMLRAARAKAEAGRAGGTGVAHMAGVAGRTGGDRRGAPQRCGAPDSGRSATPSPALHTQARPPDRS